MASAIQPSTIRSERIEADELASFDVVLERDPYGNASTVVNLGIYDHYEPGYIGRGRIELHTDEDRVSLVRALRSLADSLDHDDHPQYLTPAQAKALEEGQSGPIDGKTYDPMTGEYR